MNADPVEAIARASLYEGYVLWPYRRSALKNQRRFTFGGVYPRGFCEEAGEGDAWRLTCATLLDGDERTELAVEVRFLHLVHRQVLALHGDERVPVDRLEAGGELHLTWDEARERRHLLASRPLGAFGPGPSEELLGIPAGAEEDELRDADGRRVGLVERAFELVQARVRVGVERLDGSLRRVTASVANASAWRGRERAEAQQRALLSTHLVLRVRGGAFHSLADPPLSVADAAACCRNVGVWPVLVGAPGSTDTVLASPLLLEDHPRIAPESPGDLFDGGEIDQLLVLNILQLTDEEKREMAATDPRTRAILARTEGLTRAELARLHGTFRDPQERHA